MIRSKRSMNLVWLAILRSVKSCFFPKPVQKFQPLVLLLARDPPQNPGATYSRSSDGRWWGVLQSFRVAASSYYPAVKVSYGNRYKSVPWISHKGSKGWTSRLLRMDGRLRTCCGVKSWPGLFNPLCPLFKFER